jgi:hypothetical protein
VAERGRRPARLVELDELVLEVRGALEGEHRPLPAGNDESVVGADIEVVDRSRRLDELNEGWVVLVAAADDVFGLPLSDVLRVAHRIRLAPAAIGAVDLNLVTELSELEVGMRELRPPEADRPAGRRRDCGVGEDDGDLERSGLA